MKLYNFEIGFDQPLFLIAGPCIIESEKITLDTAVKLKEITQKLGINFVFKASFEKANRSSVSGYRGLDFAKSLQILQKVKQEVDVLLITDVHEYTPIDEVVDVVDILQTPAFLCRQTNFIQKVASFNKPLNMKKGQFLSPWEMKNVVEKARAVGNQQIMVCERGTTFGYNNLVVDMRALAILHKETGCPVIFDAGHSVQLPGSNGNATGGLREYIPVLARAAVAVGISGIFVETHPNPDAALCDGPNSWPLSKMEAMLVVLKELDAIVKSHS
jgi:2-dehydro-3-deoxyphosphooctonate aldolase (KDO 8-P synthase)